MSDDSAEFLPKLTYTEVIERDLKVIDRSAVSILAGHPISVIVFDFSKTGNLMKIINGENIGTVIS